MTPGELWGWLAETPTKIGMTRILSPQVEAVPDGLSGYVLLAESHISVHLGYQIEERIPEPNVGVLHIPAPWVWADVFTCRTMDPDAVTALVAEGLRFRPQEVQVLLRGLEHAPEPAPSVPPLPAGGGINIKGLVHG